ncbi:MAG: hypothetical protein AAF268_10295 [Cyanobacteria bacterium P01_A01_bin.3]
MSIQTIASTALERKVLTAQQEHDIALLLRQGDCSPQDRQMLNNLITALRCNQVRYANPLAIGPLA